MGKKKGKLPIQLAVPRSIAEKEKITKNLTFHNPLNQTYIIYKKIINDGLKKFADIENHIERQKAVIEYFDEQIKDENVVPLENRVSSLVNWIPLDREIKEKTMFGHLKKYESAIKKANPDLESITKLLVTVKDEVTGDILRKITPVGPGYLLENQIRSYVEHEKEIYLPEVKDFSKIDILEAQNFIVYSKKKNIGTRINEADEAYKLKKYRSKRGLSDSLGIRSFKIEIDNAERINMARVKESTRDLEKTVDWITGIRNDFHMDPTGTIVVPPDCEYLNAFETLRKLSRGRGFSYEFKKYFPEIGDILESKKTFKQKNKEVINLLKKQKNDFYKQEEKIIEELENENIHRKTYGKSSRNFSEIVTSKIRDENLRFLKLFYKVGGYKSETILMSRYQFGLYRGIFGHNLFFEEEREKKRNIKLLRNNVDLIAEHVYNNLKPLFPEAKKINLLVNNN